MSLKVSLPGKLLPTQGTFKQSGAVVVADMVPELHLALKDLAAVAASCTKPMLVPLMVF